MVELYPPGLNHADMHKHTGDMPLTTSMELRAKTLQVSQDLGMDLTISDRVNPLRVSVDSTSNWYPDDHASTIDNDMYAGWFIVNIGEEPTGSSTILRLESNTKGITLNSVFDAIASGVPQGNFDYLFKMHPATGVDAWDGSGTVTNEMGYIKVTVGPQDRYIQLYGTPP